MSTFGSSWWTRFAFYFQCRNQSDWYCHFHTLWLLRIAQWVCYLRFSSYTMVIQVYDLESITIALSRYAFWNRGSCCCHRFGRNSTVCGKCQNSCALSKTSYRRELRCVLLCSHFHSFLTLISYYLTVSLLHSCKLWMQGGKWKESGLRRLLVSETSCLSLCHSAERSYLSGFDIRNLRIFEFGCENFVLWYRYSWRGVDLIVFRRRNIFNFLIYWERNQKQHFYPWRSYLHFQIL